jgi:uncharacterized protein YbjT (DUF2867 family)
LSNSGQSARVLCRTLGKADEVRAAGLEPVIGSFDDVPAVAEAMRECDRLFLLIGAREDHVDIECRLIDAASAAGIRQVVAVSASDAHPDSPVPWARWHAAGDAHLRGSDLGWTLLKPTAFMQNFLSWTAMISQGIVFGVSGAGRVPWVDTVDIGQVAARILVKGGHEHCTYYLTGQELLSVPDGLQRIARAVGHPIDYRDAPVEVYRAKLSEHLPPWMVDGVVAQFHDVLRNGHVPDVTHEVSNILGRPARTLDDFISDHRQLFTKH